LRALGSVPLFADLSEEDLIWLASAARRLSVPRETVLLEEGTPGDCFYLILRGEFEVTRTEGGRRAVLEVLGPGGFLSEMSILEERPRSASARALTEGEVLALDPEDFKALLVRSPGAAFAMLRTVTSRLRSTESALIAHGRMVGLGTLSAGLAHELNNPAAAIVRSTDLLALALGEWQRRSVGLARLSLNEREVQALRSLEANLIQVPEALPLEEWLERQGAPEAWNLAPPLAAAGWSLERLEELRTQLSPGHLEPVLTWMAAGAEALTLAQEIRQAGKAISSIVAGLRSCSSAGREPTRPVSVRESLATALSILKGKIRPGVRLVQDIPPDLPPVEAHPGELSQVWVNLLDNALDAMGGEGILEIRARGAPEGVTVQIQDSGPGIPPEVRPRIFDPFFTTKPQGEGTGLGLAITYGFVVNQYRGSIRVDSRPGRTVFEVALPPRTPAPSGPSESA
jgi:signal transduction histidine kinase